MDKKMLVSFLYHIGNSNLGNDACSIRAQNDLVVLVTAAGTITGKLLLKADEANVTEYAADSIFLTTAEAFEEKSADNSLILLKDAVLQAVGCKISYRYLYVCADSIIAVSLTNSNAD